MLILVKFIKYRLAMCRETDGIKNNDSREKSHLLEVAINWLTLYQRQIHLQASNLLIFDLIGACDIIYVHADLVFHVRRKI